MASWPWSMRLTIMLNLLKIGDEDLPVDAYGTRFSTRAFLQKHLSLTHISLKLDLWSKVTTCFYDQRVTTYHMKYKQYSLLPEFPNLLALGWSCKDRRNGIVYTELSQYQLAPTWVKISQMEIYCRKIYLDESQNTAFAKMNCTCSKPFFNQPDPQPILLCMVFSEISLRSHFVSQMVQPSNGILSLAIGWSSLFKSVLYLIVQSNKANIPVCKGRGPKILHFSSVHLSLSWAFYWSLEYKGMRKGFLLVTRSYEGGPWRLLPTSAVMAA